ncbi:MAG: 50S ribosomal protein L4 [Simkania negevensis]|nr:50S ribosomal protein L4 [Simkania negevensis]
MANVKKYNLQGEELASIEIDEKNLKLEMHSLLVKDYLMAIRRNQRQWSANTRGRSEIRGSNKKPHPQKGTGNARQGSLKVAQFRGGATVFGPKPKFDQHVRINQKERRAAIQHLLSLKIVGGNLIALNLAGLKEAKTKTVAQFLSKVGLRGKGILFLGSATDTSKAECEQFVKSMRNIPRTRFLPYQAVSGYDVIANQEIIILDTALDGLLSQISGGKAT